MIWPVREPYSSRSPHNHEYQLHIDACKCEGGVKVLANGNILGVYSVYISFVSAKNPSSRYISFTCSLSIYIHQIVGPNFSGPLYRKDNVPAIPSLKLLVTDYKPVSLTQRLVIARKNLAMNRGKELIISDAGVHIRRDNLRF